jgi:protein MpaA
MRPRLLVLAPVLLVAGSGSLVLGAGGGRVPQEGERAERAGQRPLDPFAGSSGPRVAMQRPVGRSARGRQIRLSLFGNPAARRKLLVFGCIHGDECAGTAVTRLLLVGCPPENADVALVENLNPDGRAGVTRLNGRGVDLNRNFSSGWRPIGRRGDPQYSGPRPFSEPETRVARRLVRSLHPDVTIWFHQQATPLVRAWGRSIPAARRYARLAGLPFWRLPWLAGTAPNWQNHSFAPTASFVVELAPGRLSRGAARRHAAAIERLAGYRGENARGARDRRG